MTTPQIIVTLDKKPDMTFTEQEWRDWGGYDGFGLPGRPLKKEVTGIETVYKPIKK